MTEPSYAISANRWLATATFLAVAISVFRASGDEVGDVAPSASSGAQIVISGPPSKLATSFAGPMRIDGVRSSAAATPLDTGGRGFRIGLSSDWRPAAAVAQSAQDRSGQGSAEGGGGDLADRATNPAAALIQLQLQNVFQPNSRLSDGYGNQFIVQPVVPLKLNKAWYFNSMVWRGTLPIVSDPDYDVSSTGGLVSLARPGGTSTFVAPPGTTTLGGDTNLGDFVNLFAFPKKVKVSDTFGYEWAPIATVSLPTATDTIAGTGKLSLGPGFLLIGARKNLFKDGDTLQFGGYGYNLWSVAGPNGRADVSELFAGPILTYHFADLFGQKGWYARWTDELMSFNWNAGSGGVAQIPVGAAVGKVFSIGKQPMNVFLGANYNAAHRGDHAPYYDIKLNVTFLFPE